MTQGRNRTRPFRLPYLLLIFLPLYSLIPDHSARAQTAPSRHTADDVVMLSLEAINPQVEIGQHVREGLLGDSDSELEVEKHLLAIQMNIVRETAKFGPVLLLAPDQTTMYAVSQRCNEFQICELLKSDRVRMKVVMHDGLWIRDFGPQIEVVGNSAHVVHWRYFDLRLEEAKQEKLRELETARVRLLAARQQQDQPDALHQQLTPEARKAVDSTIDARLYVLRQYTDLLKETSPQRANDQNSAYDIADAVLEIPDFDYISSPVALDGGNLFKLDDGRCLTTRVLLSRNKDQNFNLDQELEKLGGCKEVTYLEPLPGDVIEHIDMFALPVGGKRILLASYDLSGPFASEYWGKLSDAERDLAMNAGLAMEADAEQLRRLGYEVLNVPSPFPRIPANGHTYYPSVLNALVRTSTDGFREILVPSYKDYEAGVQTEALKEIAQAFGPKTEIVSIEATAAAKAQGAIHCLTLAAPLRLSIFGDSADLARRSAALALKEQLDRSVADQIASQIPPTGLQGTWAVLPTAEGLAGAPQGPYPQRIFFSTNEFQRGAFGQLESKGNYEIDKKDLASWTLRFVFLDKNVSPAVVQWLSKDEVKLTLESDGSTMLLRRIDSDPTSPFKLQQRSPQ
jgi:agmatine/peptidylarginine deiminase